MRGVGWLPSLLDGAVSGDPDDLDCDGSWCLAGEDDVGDQAAQQLFLLHVG